MRGITPARLGVVALVCILCHVANPGFVGDPFFVRIARTLHNASIFFLAALPMLFLVVRAEMATGNSPARSRIAWLALAVLAGAVLFPTVRWGLRMAALPVIGTAGSYWEYSLGHFFKSLIVGGLLTSILFFAARERDVRRRLHQTRMACVDIERQMGEARLQLLQAQIEPHFLFNCLASVKRLFELDAAKGQRLLGNLEDYLRVAISRVGMSDARVGDEIALARSFLGIFQVRMGSRLRVSIDVAAELEPALVPPLMIGTLVENAIKHGIGPRASGGNVSIAVRRDGNVLEIAVCDDGVGFRARSGNGVGLANIRARLQTLFAASGALELAANAGHGVTATLRLPYRTAQAAA